MANEEVTQAKLDLLRAQTDAARATSSMVMHELAHKEAGDAERVYHFPAPIIPATIDTAIEVMGHWLSIDPIKTVTLALNSPGGNVFDSFALYDWINDRVEQGAPIDTTSFGMCASGAALILQAGRTRSLHRNSFLMAHEVQTMVEGAMQNAKDQLAFTESLAERIKAIMVQRSKGQVTPEEYHLKTLHRNWWMTPEEALAAGFIDFIAQ